MSNTVYRLIIVCATFISVALASYWLSLNLSQTPGAMVFPLITIVAGAIVAVCVIKQPYWGILIIISTLPIIGILPDNAILIIGAITIGGFLSSVLANKTHRIFPNLTPVHILSGLFVIWIFVSNPTAALPRGDRNWIFTFVQLIILVAFMSEMVTTRSRQELLMWAFALSSVVAAILLLQQVAEGVVGDDLGSISSGANAAGRYFLIAIVFLLYLKDRVKKVFIPIILCGAVLLLVGLWFSSSRSMFLVLGVVLFLFVLQTLSSKSSDRVRQLVGLGTIIAAVAIIGILVGGASFIETNVVGTLVNDDDTVGTRTRLWEAGLRMWRDYPIAGVGIGRFPDNLPLYGEDLLESTYLDIGAHNMYIAVISETGLVGFGLFIALLVVSLRSFWRAIKQGSRDEAAVAWTWLIIFVVLLLGGITKHDQYDKFLWASIGVAAYFHRLVANRSSLPEFT